MDERRRLVRRTADREMLTALKRFRESAAAENDNSGARKLMRRAIRHHCSVEVSLTGGATNHIRSDVWSPVQLAVKGRVLDLSLEGCSIFTRDPFEAGQRATLKLVLDKEGNINADSGARWTKALPEKGGYVTGFQFARLSVEDCRKVEVFLKRMDATAGL